MTKTELSAAIKPYLEDNSTLVWTDPDDVAGLLNFIGTTGGLEVGFDGLTCVHDTHNGYGMQASYWSRKISRAIILATEDAFSFNNADDFLEWLLGLHTLARHIETKLPKLKY